MGERSHTALNTMSLLSLLSTQRTLFVSTHLGIGNSREHVNNVHEKAK